MLNDPLYQELVALEAEFDKDEVTVSDLKVARRALAITKELYSQYGDQALIKSFIGDNEDLEELFHTEEEKHSAALSAIAEEKIEALDS